MSEKKKWVVKDDRSNPLIVKSTGMVFVWDDEKTAKAEVAAHYGKKRMPNGFATMRVSEEQIAELNANVGEPEAGEYDPAMDAQADEPANLPANDEPVWDEGAPVHVAEIVNDEDDSDLDWGIEEMDCGERMAVANKLHHKAEAALVSSFEYAARTGAVLLSTKEEGKRTKAIAHGEWKSYVEANFDGSYQSAVVYMRIAKNVQKAIAEGRKPVAFGSIREFLAEGKSESDGKGGKSGGEDTDNDDDDAPEWSFTLTSEGEMFVNVGGEQTEVSSLVGTEKAAAMASGLNHALVAVDAPIEDDREDTAEGLMQFLSGVGNQVTNRVREVGLENLTYDEAFELREQVAKVIAMYEEVLAYVDKHHA